MSIWNVISIILLIAACIAHEDQGSANPLKVSSRQFRGLEENEEDRGYVEQCRTMNLGKGHLARVNVFAFLNPSWYYSYRQAIMLKLLKKRLERSGFTDILFFVVTPPPNLPEDNAENSIEMKTWKEISNNIWKSEYFLNIEETLFNDPAKDSKNDIVFVQDTRELNIWEKFRALKDEVAVVDRCGKLTYQVIVPWSILYFPYVKAAILSTYKEDPCGPCDMQPALERDSMDYEEFLLRNTNSNEKKTEHLNSHEKTIENDRSTSTATTPFHMSSSTISDIITEETETFKYSESESINQSANETQFETTSEIVAEQEQTQRSITISDSLFTIGGITRADQRNDLDVELQKNDYNAANEDPQKHEQIERPESLPLRIILYSPHLHQEAETSRKYTHVILKAGSPDYHDHFNSRNTISDQSEVPVKFNTTPNRSKPIEYMDGINESPGVYGEIADYWRSSEDDESNNKNENTEFVDYDDATVSDTTSNPNDAFEIESSILQPSDIDAVDMNTNITNNDETTGFVQHSLIEHYRKLLTWIYYII